MIHTRMHSLVSKRPSDRRGAMTIMVLAMIFVFIATVVLSVDLAYMHLTRSELRSATDAAAKAAATTLSQTQNRNAAIAEGQAIASLNLVSNRSLRLDATNFQFGHADEGPNGRYEFRPNIAPFNSVRVRGTQPTPLFFGRVMGVNAFQPEETSVATFLDRDVVLVVDRSGSMRGRKFADLKRAVREFINVLRDNGVEERVGLAAYDTASTRASELTSDSNRVAGIMDAMDTGGGTSISRGMDAGRAIINLGRSATVVEKTMLVMTDGLHNSGREPRLSALEVAADGVTIHAITFGTGADRGRMQEIAAIGRGRHIHADTGTQLIGAFREIANTLSAMLTD